MYMYMYIYIYIYIYIYKYIHTYVNSQELNFDDEAYYSYEIVSVL